jgi:hypothetical protein
MSRIGLRTRRPLVLAAAVAAVVSFGSVTARAEDPSYEDLKQQLQQLQARIEQLETQQHQLSAKDVDETVERVLKDAEKRSQLLQMEGFTAGYQKGKGFLIQDAAGNWVLHPFFQFQFRSTTNWRNDGKHDGSDTDIENGFEIRRMKFGFEGNAFTPNLGYYFRWNTVSNTGGSVGDVVLEEAWIRYQFNDDWAFRVGQITDPTFHEQTTSSGKQLAVERSLVNQLITGSNQAYVQAVTLQYDHKGAPIQAEFGISDGFQSQNTDFVDTNEGGNNDWAVTGRVNFFVMGERRAYDDFTALGTKADLLVIGAGGNITQSGDSTVYLHTVDAQYENTTGLALYAGYLANYVDQGSNGGDDLYNWGALVQAGYLLNDQWEVFGRYDYTNLDTSGDDEFCEITLGVNWYVGGSHNAKVTVDGTWLPNGSPSDQKGLGILAGSDNQFLVRGQFQLLL